MNKNNDFPALIILLLLVGLFLLSACRPTSPDRVQATGTENVAGEVSSNFDYEQAAEDMAFRWTAMGREYERLGLLNNKLDPGDVMAFRWTAMAQAYERLGLLNDKLDPGDVMAFRWLAMARAYEKFGLLNDK